MSTAPSARHQQEGIRLVEFAALHGLTSGQATRLARGGKIMGAQRHSVSGHWFVYPPAKIMGSIRPYAKPHLPLGETQSRSVDLPLPMSGTRGVSVCAFDLGTSPHGLPADSLRSCPKDSGSVPLSLLEDQQAEGAQVFAVGFDSGDEDDEGSEPPVASFASEDGESDESDESDDDLAFVKQKMPEVFRTPEVRSAGRSIKAALLKRDPHTHRLALDDCEFLHLFHAVEHCRSRMRKTIGKGLHKVGSLRATDSLWQKLQAEMQRCHQRRPA